MANANPAEAEDASVLWFNPAGMTNLSGNQAVLGAGYLVFKGDFDNDPTRSISSGGGPATGGDGGDFGVDSPVPSFYAALELDTPMPAYMGIGINAPFALATSYEYGWIGRYDALESTLTNFNINPAVSVALNDFISIGAGVNVQYSTVTLSQAIDTGAFVGSPAADDSMVTMEADGFAPGYNFGVMLYPSDRFRMGVSYRSSLSLDYDGTADFDLSDSGEIVSGSGVLADTGITSHLDLPDSLSVHAFYQATEKLALMSDVTWTNWSKVQSIPITFDNPSQPDQSLILEYHDTIRVSLGAAYDVNDDLTLRFGAAFDETPQPDETRGFRIPDANQWIVGAGAKWSPRPWLNFGLGYTFYYLEEADIDVTTPTGAGSSNRAAGTSDAHAHLFVLEGSIKF